jgi:hypothetical protein
MTAITNTQLEALTELVEHGPVEESFLDRLTREQLIELGFAIRIVVRGADGYLAATHQGRDMYKWAYDEADSLAEAIRFRLGKKPY